MMALARKLISNNVYKVFLWIFLVMMMLGSGIVVFHNEEEKNWVMKVYEQTLSDKKYAIMLQRVKQQQELFRQKGYAFNLQNPQKEAVDASLGDLLSLHILHSLGLHVSSNHVDREVQKQLQQLPSYFFHENGALNEEAFRKLIAPNSIEDFVSSVETDAKHKLLYGLLDASLYVPQFELKAQFTADFTDKNYVYFSLPLSSFMQTARKDVPSDEKLQKFYKKTAIADQFKTIEKRSGTMWVFDQNQYVSSISQEEVKQYYDKNKNSRYVLEPSQMQVRLLLITVEPGKEQEAISRIQELKEEAEKTPGSFETLVQKFSDDKATASKGGLTGFFDKNDTKLSKIVVETAFEYLGTDGQISAPIKTDRGYELIQRVKKNPAKYKEFSAVESGIKQELGAEKFKKRFAQDASRVINNAKYNKEALLAFIKRYQGKEVAIALTARKQGLEINNLFKMDEGRYTQFFDKDKGVILLCSQIEKSVLPPFAEVKDRVLELYYQTQAKSLLQDALKMAQKDAQSMSFEKLAAKYESSVQKASVRYVDGKAEYSQALKAPEIQAKLKSIQSPGVIIAIETAQNGLLLQLVDIAENENKFEAKKDELQKVIFYTKMYQSREAFIASLYRIAKLNNKIEIKNEILQFTKEV